ncbi:MAG: hypothetical protein ACREMZ_15700 [Gemmatimonadales bacterium]
MRAILGTYLLLSVSISTGYVLAVLMVDLARRTRQRRRAARALRAARAAALCYGGVIQPKRRIRPSPAGGIDVLASCAAEAAEVIAANRGLEVRTGR